MVEKKIKKNAKIKIESFYICIGFFAAVCRQWFLKLEDASLPGPVKELKYAKISIYFTHL